MFPTPSDRVQVRQIGDLMPPGACALCGSGNCEDGYLDVGVWYEYEGQVYFCMTCVEQFIATVNGLTGDEAAHLRAVSEEVAKQNAELRGENDDLRSKLSAWYTVLDGSIDSKSDSDTSVPTGTEEQPSSDGNTNDAPKPTVSRKPVAKKSVASRRPHDSSQSASSNFPV